MLWTNARGSCVCQLPNPSQWLTTPADGRSGAGKTKMERRDERELREELVQLRTEHRLLDEEIVSLEANPTAVQLLIKRLKKRKLALKDRITSVEDRLLPDIIA